VGSFSANLPGSAEQSVGIDAGVDGDPHAADALLGFLELTDFRAV
jgi:hypothetical protein